MLTAVSANLHVACPPLPRPPLSHRHATMPPHTTHRGARPGSARLCSSRCERAVTYPSATLSVLMSWRTLRGRTLVTFSVMLSAKQGTHVTTFLVTYNIYHMTSLWNTTGSAPPDRAVPGQPKTGWLSQSITELLTLVDGARRAYH